jgi:Na+-driven multidrug efflux pump
MARDAKLTRGSVAGHLLRQTAPMVLGVAAIMSVGLADAYFLGRLGRAELAAIGFVFPVTTALASLGVGVIAGVSSVVSRALGEGTSTRRMAARIWASCWAWCSVG